MDLKLCTLVHFALVSKNLYLCYMSERRLNGHTVLRLTVHIVWSTKYRYPILEGDVQKKCRSILIQVCDSEGVNILKGVVINLVVKLWYFTPD